MPVLAAVPIYYVGAAAFTSIAAAYAYINREGLSESISDAYDYYTGKDDLVSLEELGIKTNESSNTYKTYDYAYTNCLLYTSPSPRDATLSRMPSSA